jgi:hypothetical protein
MVAPFAASAEDRFWAAAIDLNMPITIHSNVEDDRGTLS